MYLHQTFVTRKNWVLGLGIELGIILKPKTPKILYPNPKPKPKTLKLLYPNPKPKNIYTLTQNPNPKNIYTLTQNPNPKIFWVQTSGSSQKRYVNIGKNSLKK